jgi:hypothetical protein
MTDETKNGEQVKCPVYVTLQKLRETQRELKKEAEKANEIITEKIGKLETELRVKPGAIEKHHFDQKHGPSVFTRGRHLYASGAQWNPNNLHYGPDIEPPPEPDVWVLQIEYLGVKIEGLVTERDKIKNAVANQNTLALRSSAPTADELWPGWREDLKLITTKLVSLRNKQGKLKQKLKEQDENWHRQQRLIEARSERRSNVAASTAELNRMLGE